MKDTIQLVCNAYSDTEDWRYLLQATVRGAIEKHYDSVINQLSKEIEEEEKVTRQSPLNEEIKPLRSEVARTRTNAENKYFDYKQYLSDHHVKYRSDISDEELSDIARLKNAHAIACEEHNAVLKKMQALVSERDGKLRQLRASRRVAKQYRDPKIGYLKMVAAAIEYSCVEGSDKSIALLMDALDNAAVQQFPNFCNKYLQLFDLPSIEELAKVVSDEIRENKKFSSTDDSVALKYIPNPYDLCMREDYDRASSYCVCSDMYYHIDHAKITDIVTKKGYASCIKIV